MFSAVRSDGVQSALPRRERNESLSHTSKVACIAIATAVLTLAVQVNGEEMTFSACYNACVQQDAFPGDSPGKVFSCFFSCFPHLTAFL